jgi:SAM-dependent methyltransferase
MTTTSQPPQTIDEAKVEQFVGQALTELGATLNAALVVIGDRLGLYKAMADGRPVTPAQLAERTSTDERSVREWLNAQAAGGYVTYNSETETYTLPLEHAFVLAMEDSPVFLPGAFELMAGAVRDEPRVTESFRSGAGLGWHEHDEGVFHGCERFFRPGYQHNLVQSWIPALDGVAEKLAAGARVADVGCGHGASTLIMAEAFPNSEFVGFDYHAQSIEQATARARAAGLDDRVRFEVAPAQGIPGGTYDLVCTFDCLHDMGDPVGAAREIRRALADDGTWLIVEPFAGDTVEENLNPVGRIYYAASTLLCTPASLAQDVGLALGAQAGEARLRDVVTAGGLSRFRRAAETPFNLVLEARP